MVSRPSHRLLVSRFVVVTLALLMSVPAAVSAAPTGGATPKASALEAGGERRYVVVQSEPPVALYEGGIAGLAPTSPEVLGELKLDPDSPASLAYVAHLEEARAELLARLAEALGRSVDAQFEYNYALNGFTTRLTEAEAAIVETTPGVAFVHREETLHTVTDSGPQWIDADEVWDGSAVGGAPSKGERIVAGIIDTGVNVDHPSFAEIGPVDGYAHENPRGRFYGVCAATPPPVPGSLCNNKLIGLYDFTGSNAGVHDDVGHGSHTASTVAGNVVDATYYAPTVTLPTQRISGVAPHANVISYKGCRGTAVPVLGACPLTALLAAIDQATADVVDVINFSIGGGSVNPWQDPLGLSFFGAHAAGVFVAASAGNSGPNPQTIGRPANSPWLLAVGASTHNRRPTGRLEATKANGDPVRFVGMSLTDSVGPLALVDAAALGNELCNPFSGTQAAEIVGKIVVCTQGAIGRVEKGQNVKNAGGAGMVLVSQAGYKNSVISDGHVIPTVMIGELDGRALREWLAGADSPQATIEGVTLEKDTELADRMAGFSSRGPDLNLAGVIKPDVTAPGVSILAAFHAHAGPAGEPEYNMIQGTSMSSPHAAGAGALLRALHRDWSPDQIKSALMSTAFTVPDGAKETVGVTKEDHSTPVDPFDVGGGRIDVASAAQAGFTVAESVAGYQAANPRAGGNPSALNLASMANPSCRTTCTWTRTLVSTTSAPVAYSVNATSGPGFTLSVSPSSFTLDGSQTITITATNTGLVPSFWQFGQLTFSPEAAGLPAQHFPVAVKTSGAAPEQACEIPETVVSTSPAAANVPPYNDVREVALAGVFPTYGGEQVPNIEFRMRVTQLGLAGSLPPNQHWRIAFVPPGAPAGTSYFVQMVTDSTSQPTFVYGTLAGGSFTTLGAPEAGSFSLADNDIRWTIAAGKILNPKPGDTLSAIIGASGAAQPGTLTTNLKTAPAGSYTLQSCTADPDPTPTPTPTPSPTPAPADLQVTAMSASSQKAKEGDRVTVSATVSNTGESEAGATSTEFRLDDGTLIGVADTPAVGAGGSTTVQVGWDTRGLKGDYVITATADSAGVVTEGDEGNNRGTLTVTVRGNKVQNGSFEQANEEGSAPKSWQAESTGAGETGWSEGSSEPGGAGTTSDGERAVTISGTGGSVAVAGMPTWTSAPIEVSAGEVLTLTADVQTAGTSSAPSISLAYLGTAGELVSNVTVLTAPVTSDGFEALEQTVTVPAGVTSLRIVLAGFAPTDASTKGTVTFDDIGLFGE